MLLGQENFPRRYYPDRVRGYFSAPHIAEHPCFNNTIETLRAGMANGRTRAQHILLP